MTAALSAAGKEAPPAPPPRFEEAVRAAIGALLASDTARVVVTEDASDLAGWPAAQRIVVPVADRAALAFAGGLALGGRPAIVELSGSARLPAVAEVLAELGAVHLAGESAAPVLVRVPFGSEAVGLDQPVGRWLVDLPGVAVVAASSGGHAAALVARWGARPAPTVLLEPRVLSRDRSGGHTSAAACGVRAGDAVVLAAVGAHVGAALEAAESLAGEGVSAAVVDLVQLSPFPDELLGAEVRRCGRMVFVGDDPWLARRARQAAVDGAFEYLESPLTTATPDPVAIAAAVRGAFAW